MHEGSAVDPTIGPYREEVERLTFERMPAAIGLLLTFLIGALPVELYYHPQNLSPYLVVYAAEVGLSGVCWVAVGHWRSQAVAIATTWASLMGLCVTAYYPLVHNDATIALAALICLVSVVPATLPFGAWHQLIFGAVCALSFFGVVLPSGVPVSLPWLYSFVAFLAVLCASTAGARAQTAFRREAFRRETSLRAAEEHLRTALTRAESAVALRTRLVANVSHELRTPVNVVIGYADMLLDPATRTGEARQLAGRIREYGVTLDSLVSGLLDLSRLSSGKIEPAVADIEVGTLLDEIAHGARLMVRQKPVRVVVDCTAGSFRSDPVRVRQILGNLAANAAKFTREGTIAIAASAGRDWVTFIVKDTGCGIPDDKHDVIFTAFEQLAPGAPAGGIGLGLAIVRQLIDVLGGAIHLDSTPGRGATFTVMLPQLQAAGSSGVAA